jgi:hypothetical protein
MIVLLLLSLGALVKSDVMVGIEGGPFKQDVQRAFIEKAVVNLAK